MKLYQYQDKILKDQEYDHIAVYAKWAQWIMLQAEIIWYAIYLQHHAWMYWWCFNQKMTKSKINALSNVVKERCYREKGPMLRTPPQAKNLTETWCLGNWQIDRNPKWKIENNNQVPPKLQYLIKRLNSYVLCMILWN